MSLGTAACSACTYGVTSSTAGRTSRPWADTFTVATRLVEPRTDLRGMRASRDLASQLLDHLVEMEQAYLAGR